MPVDRRKGVTVSNPTPWALGVRCDAIGCIASVEGAFLVSADDDSETRLGYVLNHAEGAGWTVIGRETPSTAATYCPAHKR